MFQVQKMYLNNIFVKLKKLLYMQQFESYKPLNFIELMCYYSLKIHKTKKYCRA